MRTTIALDSTHRDRLLELKRKWGLPSTEAVIARLLEGRPETATALYRRHKKAVDAVLKKHGVRRVVAFGSRARGDARPDSDLDLVVELPPDADLFDFNDVREELAAAFGLPVDIIEPAGLRASVRKRVQAEGITLVE